MRALPVLPRAALIRKEENRLIRTQPVLDAKMLPREDDPARVGLMGWGMCDPVSPGSPPPIMTTSVRNPMPGSPTSWQR